jgi:hypothetical protein
MAGHSLLKVIIDSLEYALLENLNSLGLLLQ